MFKRVSGWIPVVAPLLGCGSSGGSGDWLDVGSDEAGPALLVTGGDAGGTEGLDAHIEQGRVAVKLITVSCSGNCVTVQAVGTGGNPPYMYAWENGSTSATRTVCPTSGTTYSVKVTDTGQAGEVPRPAETAGASVTADVLACHDGGVTGADGGLLCITNPSFAGTPSVSVQAGAGAPPWASCAGFSAGTVPASVSNAAGLPPDSDGGDCLYFYDSPVPAGTPAVGEALCAPMRAGVSYSMTVDLAYVASGGPPEPPPSLQIIGTTAPCAAGHVLWSSPGAGPTWMRYCATFTPPEDLAYIGLSQTNPMDGGLAQLLVANIIPVTACP
jgi:hypothetical protein